VLTNRVPAGQVVDIRQYTATARNSAEKRRTINRTLYAAIHEKTGVTSEQTIYPPKVPQKPNFIDILNAWTWIPVQTVLHESEIFHNYHVTECGKNVPNAIYNTHG